MVLYPEVQSRAHSEIESVIGGDRLPTFDDRKLLPYVEAIYRETLRWHPILPIGESCDFFCDVCSPFLKEFSMSRLMMTYIKGIIYLKVCYSSKSSSAYYTHLYQLKGATVIPNVWCVVILLGNATVADIT